MFFKKNWLYTAQLPQMHLILGGTWQWNALSMGTPHRPNPNPNTCPPGYPQIPLQWKLAKPTSQTPHTWGMDAIECYCDILFLKTTQNQKTPNQWMGVTIEYSWHEIPAKTSNQTLHARQTFPSLHSRRTKGTPPAWHKTMFLPTTAWRNKTNPNAPNNGWGLWLDIFGTRIMRKLPTEHCMRANFLQMHALHSSNMPTGTERWFFRPGFGDTKQTENTKPTWGACPTRDLVRKHQIKHCVHVNVSPPAHPSERRTILNSLKPTDNMPPDSPNSQNVDLTKPSWFKWIRTNHVADRWVNM